MNTTKGLNNDCFALPPGVEWTPVDEALALLQSRLNIAVGQEVVTLGKAANRIAAQDVKAVRANPPNANSAVDGYGFAAASLPANGDVTLRLIEGRAAAGAPFAGVVPEGAAIRILTGASLPKGVDTVVLEEDVVAADDVVRFAAGIKPFSNARKAGEDVEAASLILRRGRLVSPPEIALMAATGVSEVSVFSRLRVGVLSTGDELLEVGEIATGDQIFDANRPMLLTLLAQWGFDAVDLGRAPDDRDALRDCLDRASQTVDAILTSGGASAGDEDHLSAILNAEGKVHSWRIALKPGRPLALGQWQGVPLFGLPGNPVAALVCTLIFARPALFQMAGRDWLVPLGFDVPAAFQKSKKAGRREYLRARLTPEGHGEPFVSEGSGRISGLSWAQGLIELGDEAQQISPGDPVRFYPYASFGITT